VWATNHCPIEPQLLWLNLGFALLVALTKCVSQMIRDLRFANCGEMLFATSPQIGWLFEIRTMVD